MISTVKIMMNDSGVDAELYTKDMAVRSLAEQHGIALKNIAVVGDSVADLQMMKVHGVGLVACPDNSQQHVIRHVSRARGYVSPHDVYEGFEDIYRAAAQRRLDYVVTDRDGVLKMNGDRCWGHRFSDLAMNMGQHGPYIFIVTSSSEEQNIEFAESYGLAPNLAQNPYVADLPEILLMESGTVRLDVLRGETRLELDGIDTDVLGVLNTEFEERAKRRIQDFVFPEFGFAWAEHPDDQQGRAYHSHKQTQVSFSVPRQWHNGARWRKTPQANLYRNLCAGVMAETADELGLDNVVL